MMATTTLEDFRRTKATPRMHDPLADFEPRERPPVDLRQAARTLMGAVLLSAGVFVCLWVVYLVHATVFRTDRIELLRRLVPGQKDELVLTVPPGKVELPPGVMRLAAYVLLVPLVFLGAKVGLAVVKEGCGLLRHESVAVAEEAPAQVGNNSPATTEAELKPLQDTVDGAGVRVGLVT